MDLWKRLSDNARQTLASARNIARGQGCNEVAPEHIALGLLAHPTCVGCEILREMGIDRRRLHKALTEAAAQHAEGGAPPDEIAFDTTARRCLQMAALEARRHVASQRPATGDTPLLSTGHLLLGLISPSSTAGLKALRAYGVFYGEAGEILKRLT
jgi:ATP-dependent Clp protease ATP-binding subunit ClpA